MQIEVFPIENTQIYPDWSNEQNLPTTIYHHHNYHPVDF